ncbi:hypothetical protein RB598_002073 [Gaeumannomyces tritici]
MHTPRLDAHTALGSETAPESMMASSLSPHPRPRHSRSRLGCLTCRSRKKKCDQVKPRCAGCRRNQIFCDWPSGSNNPQREGTCSQVGILAAAAAAAAATGAPPPKVTFHISTPAPSLSAHLGPERACSLTPQSSLLLGHYLRETAAHFAMLPLRDNPFVTILLPLACADDLLMHAILAFSGSHLACKEPGSPVATATELHYARLIGGLRSELARLLREGESGERAARLLPILMVASHYEAISGDAQGAMFSHLRACRSLIMSLTGPNGSGRSLPPSIMRDSLGFSIELYTYISVNNMLTYQGHLADADTASDPFVVPLEDMAAFPTFGALFAGGHELFRLVPQVSQLASRRLAQETDPPTPPSSTLQAAHDDLLARITSWTMPQQPRAAETASEWGDRATAAEAFRQGLLTYLAAAAGGSRVASDAGAMGAIGRCAGAFYGHALRLQLAPAPYTVSLMWPTMMVGSCMVDAAQRETLERGLRRGRFAMRHLGVMADVLRLLWDDPDPRAFGPNGLRLIMRKHGITFGVV